MTAYDLAVLALLVYAAGFATVFFVLGDTVSTGDAEEDARNKRAVSLWWPFHVLSGLVEWLRGRRP